MTPLYTFKLVRQSSVREPLAKMSTPAASAALARQAIGESAIEVFLAIGLNSSGKVLGVFEVARGTYDSCAVDPRVLFAGLLNMGPVSGFVLAHNHPSGEDLAEWTQARWADRQRTKGAA